MKSFKKFFEEIDDSQTDKSPTSKLDIARQRFASIRKKASEMRKQKNKSGYSGEAKFNTQKAKFGTMHKQEEEK
tara:strand:+ start:394 stop:615 length:222 start_codon:yes stop_codon:yes gene_type:complete